MDAMLLPHKLYPSKAISKARNWVLIECLGYIQKSQFQ